GLEMEGRVQFSTTKDENQASSPRPSPPPSEEREKNRQLRNLGRSSHFGRWKSLVLKVWVLKNFHFRPILDGARQHRRLPGAEMEERRRPATPHPGPLPSAEREKTAAAHLRRFQFGNG